MGVGPVMDGWIADPLVMNPPKGRGGGGGSILIWEEIKEKKRFNFSQCTRCQGGESG